MPPTVTRTLNPLPFEHLEPKRFEDLARQLAYDFRVWRQLEATGRSGSDYGFDARGFEIVPSRGGDRDLESELSPDTLSDRMWLIQCKRERSIGPNKMKQHLALIPQESIDNLHGILFVAACDFSKTTRDVLRSWCIDNGIAEWQIWGKGEIEDLLFQPKNDGLLFAYFGISLRMKQQKVATNLRRVTTVKRKLKRLLDDGDHTIAIIRDVSDDNYPECDNAGLINSGRLWRVVHLRGLGVGGLRFLLHQFRAYHNRTTGEWDIASGLDLSEPDDLENPWRVEYKEPEQRDLNLASHEFWISIPDAYRTEMNFAAEIPYEAILEIDEIGDSVSELPTIYVDFKDGAIPTGNRLEVTVGDPDPFLPPVYVEKHKHRRIFPENLRDEPWEAEWAERNNFALARERFEIQLEPPPWLLEVKAAAARSAGKLDGDAQ